MGAQLELEDVRKSYGATAAVDGVSHQVAEGAFAALLGPSGCGKTTLLRLIAGLIAPDSGAIRFEGKAINEVPSYRRNFGFVFQNYALFPHMTVAENIGYGLRIRGIGKDQKQTRVRDALARVGLHGIEERFPAQLSGGQQQRVALARALVIQPRLLLLDEPLAALDKKLREEMQVELRLLQKGVGITTVFVTHDQEEALTLSDDIAVMRDGKIIQSGTPTAVYDRPLDRFVAGFLGTTNFIPGRARGAQGGEIAVSVSGATVLGRSAAHQPETDQLVDVAVRPEKVNLTAEPAPNRIPGRVVGSLFQGHRVIVMFKTEGGLDLQVFGRPGQFNVTTGDKAYIWWEPQDATVVEAGAPGETGAVGPAAAERAAQEAERG